jgi:hypothetical protein
MTLLPYWFCGAGAGGTAASAAEASGCRSRGRRGCGCGRQAAALIGHPRCHDAQPEQHAGKDDDLTRDAAPVR